MSCLLFTRSYGFTCMFFKNIRFVFPRFLFGRAISLFFRVSHRKVNIGPSLRWHSFWKQQQISRWAAQNMMYDMRPKKRTVGVISQAPEPLNNVLCCTIKFQYPRNSSVKIDSILGCFWIWCATFVTYNVRELLKKLDDTNVWKSLFYLKCAWCGSAWWWRDSEVPWPLFGAKSLVQFLPCTVLEPKPASINRLAERGMLDFLS